MRKTFETVFSWVVIGCIYAAGYAMGHLAAENNDLNTLIKVQNDLFKATKSKEETAKETKE